LPVNNLAWCLMRIGEMLLLFLSYPKKDGVIPLVEPLRVKILLLKKGLMLAR
jgi:hypothetical protein